VPGVAGILGLPRRIDDPEGVALTFDDGPHPEGTPAVLEALDTADATATFFLCGEQVERDPALAREIAAGGHAIALHGYRHRNMLRLAPRTFVGDLERGIAAIEDALGLRPDLYRPPYGIFSYPGMVEVSARGLRSLLWSRWGHDWRASWPPERIAAEVAGDLREGDVLLLHDADHYSEPGCWRGTVEALPWILERVSSAGLRSVSA
jgi:peptidoglycan/xylan/chitin deacetylase (PgdA/CDA1 family)